MKSSPFQIILVAVFGIFIVVGMVVLYFTKVRTGTEKAMAEVSIWGVAPASYVDGVASALKLEDRGFKISYRAFSADNFDTALVEALASGVGPDGVIIGQDMLIRHQDKLYPIPYTALPERDFKDSYITEAELFMSPWGYLGIPFSIDPLIMYWNRDLFANAGVAVAPRFWDEFLRLAESLTEKSDSVTIAKSAVGLGEFSNITNAKEIISALALQSGVQFIARGAEGRLSNLIDGNKLGSAVDFYVEFSNPLKSTYTWSRSLPSSQAMFTRGDLGVYFGFVSEMPVIKAKNPNLDFDIGPFPQPRETKNRMTFGNVLGMSALKTSAKAGTIMQIALIFGGEEAVKAWSGITGLPPIRRGLLANPPGDAYSPIYYNSALWSRGWLDPSSRRTKELFRDMIESITSGWMKTGEAVSAMTSQMGLLVGGN